MFLCVSAEKGISLAFPIATTPVDYRDLLLKHYAAFCEQFAGQLRQEGATPLIDGEETPFGWWQFMTSVIQKNESADGHVDKVGVVA